MKMELVPPGCHQHNAVEVAIRNFKTHFLSVLAGVADDLPLILWDWLLPQTKTTINVLQQTISTSVYKSDKTATPTCIQITSMSTILLLS